MTKSFHNVTKAPVIGILEKLKCMSDDRGCLCVAQADQFCLPFEVKRVFWISNVPDRAVRGKHANRNCTELLVAASGSVKVILNNGVDECEVELNRPDVGLYIPPMVWCELKDFQPNTVCICMADQDYDEKYYINDLDVFMKEVNDESHPVH